MNNVSLIGRLTKDVEERRTQSGTPVVSFTLAVNRRKKDDGADFIKCIARDKAAETIAKYVHKGDKLYIEGKIRSRSYDDQNGIKRYIVEIFADNMEMLLRVQLRLARHNSQCSRVSLLSSLHRHKRYKRLTLPMICRSKAECSFSVSGIVWYITCIRYFRQYRLAAKEKKEN